ncbi:MAG: hypothetical protein ACLQAR_12980, partial [Steroidobacteraceae bacterium]
SEDIVGVLTPSNQVRSCRKCLAPPVESPGKGASFLRRKVAKLAARTGEGNAFGVPACGVS